MLQTACVRENKLHSFFFLECLHRPNGGELCKLDILQQKLTKGSFRASDIM